MEEIVNEIYDDNGLVRTELVTIQLPSKEAIIADKEAQLLKIYEELQALKS